MFNDRFLSLLQEYDKVKIIYDIDKIFMPDFIKALSEYTHDTLDTTLNKIIGAGYLTMRKYGSSTTINFADQAFTDEFKKFIKTNTRLQRELQSGNGFDYREFKNIVNHWNASNSHSGGGGVKNPKNIKRENPENLENIAENLIKKEDNLAKISIVCFHKYAYQL